MSSFCGNYSFSLRNQDMNLLSYIIYGIRVRHIEKLCSFLSWVPAILADICRLGGICMLVCRSDAQSENDLENKLRLCRMTYQNYYIILVSMLRTSLSIGSSSYPTTCAPYISHNIYGWMKSKWNLKFQDYYPTRNPKF